MDQYYIKICSTSRGNYCYERGGFGNVRIGTPEANSAKLSGSSYVMVESGSQKGALCNGSRVSKCTISGKNVWVILGVLSRMMSAINVQIWCRIRLKLVKAFLPNWACGLVGQLVAVFIRFCVSQHVMFDL